MSKISVYTVKTGESLDVPDLHYCVLDTLLMADGLVVAIESGCAACGGGSCCVSDETVGSGEETADAPVGDPAAAQVAPAADAPAAS